MPLKKWTPEEDVKLLLAIAGEVTKIDFVAVSKNMEGRTPKALKEHLAFLRKQSPADGETAASAGEVLKAGGASSPAKGKKKTAAAAAKGKDSARKDDKDAEENPMDPSAEIDGENGGDNAEDVKDEQIMKAKKIATATTGTATTTSKGKAKPKGGAKSKASAAPKAKAAGKPTVSTAGKRKKGITTPDDSDNDEADNEDNSNQATVAVSGTKNDDNNNANKKVKREETEPGFYDENPSGPSDLSDASTDPW